MTKNSYDVVVVGAGFAGLYMLHNLRNRGFSVKVFEAGGDIGGTWYWNRYPGARCDVESLEYSYQFSDELQQEWVWSERYATQGEILRYAHHVADRFDLRRDIQFDTHIAEMDFDEASNSWKTTTSDGETVVSRFCVMATGCLSSTNIPSIEGRNTFSGGTYHTGNWPHTEPDFTGKKVGIIGTGSSGVQSIPLIAEQAEHLYVFQRTPSYAIPAYNGPYDPEYERERKANYKFYREEAKNSRSGFLLAINEDMAMDVSDAERQAVYEKRWKRGGLTFLGAFNDLLTNKEANDTAADFVRGKIHDVVDDPKIAEKLSPQTVVGCKRMCVDTNYYQTYNRENVTLLDVSEQPIDAITETGIRRGGIEIELDELVFATGFDAMTGALAKINIQGRNKTTLKEKWAEGAKTYLGVAISGFPNLFIITGPGSPSVLANMMPAIEHHVEWISDCINHCRDTNCNRVEASNDAEEAWVAQTNELASHTLFPTCNSWYLGANIPGKPRIFMPYLGFQRYLAACEEIVNEGYKGFSLS
ncbi:NAD(P)/FAD-dependent oxidoreductase [Sneathiella marina]|uniref:NAD(P)/FAD-dependent oxidoreductase n=1 Tax=Sneathiella marina TaxID=2950108 RepID=A0ABY4W7N3_9PROT|nr:NAD(P)/FAD-dependent oxidoreductase [Sneathiella marina]USG61279.1 NAD(P)/FAD-dependent oxidoreductase [Sneathiella marina]